MPLANFLLQSQILLFAKYYRRDDRKISLTYVMTNRRLLRETGTSCYRAYLQARKSDNHLANYIGTVSKFTDNAVLAWERYDDLRGSQCLRLDPA